MSRRDRATSPDNGRTASQPLPNYVTDRLPLPFLELTRFQTSVDSGRRFYRLCLHVAVHFLVPHIITATV
jgi:hypothetical protein